MTDKTTQKTPDLTNEGLKSFYINLPAWRTDKFRFLVCEKCGWSYPVWHARISGKIKLSKLEAEAIQSIIDNF